MAASRDAGGRTLVTAAFLAPAVILLAVWIAYPVVYTIWRSLYDRSGDNFIWLDNYQTLFTTDTTRTAIKNNAIWVAVVPGARDGDRPRLRRAHRAHPLGASRSRSPSSCRWRSRSSPPA